MSDEKELPASSKKKLDLRRKGQVVKSQDISTTVLIATGLFSLLVLGGYWATGMANVMAACFREMEKLQTIDDARMIINILMNKGLVVSMGVFFGLVALFALLSQMLQTGFVFSTHPLEIKMNKLNPAEGLKKLFSLKKLVQTLNSFVKLVVILFFMYSAVKVLFTQPVFIRMVNVQELGGYMIKVAWEMGWRVLLVLIVISIIDYLYQRWQFEKSNRMSHADYKDEYRQTEGSPEVKKKRKKKMRQISIKRMLENMADASIVITNPTHYAVALRYVRGKDETPIVIAKGIRLIALKIKQRAQDLNIPQVENRTLAQELYKHSEVEKPIPVIFYHAVATILAGLFRRGFRQPGEEENR